MKRDFLIPALLACAVVLSVSGRAFAQTGNVDQARLQRNLEIMELVLDRLLEVQTAHGLRLNAPATQATYLPGFGVLFKVPSSRNFTVFESESGPARSSAFARNEYLVSRSDARTATGAPSRKASHEQAIIEFLTHWTGSLDHLNNNEQIAIYHESSPAISAYFDFGGGEVRRLESREEEMLALVRQSDLAALHAGKLDPGQFQARMQRQNVKEGHDDLNRIAAMIGRDLSNRAGEARGIYLENYGAVFFTNAQLGRNFMEDFWRDDNAPDARQPVNFEEFKTATEIMAALKRRAEQLAARMETVASEREQNWQTGYSQLKNRLLEIITRQSTALPRLQPQEWIVVVTDLLDAPPSQPSQLIYRVKKQDAEDFIAQNLSREQLLKRISYTEN